MSKSSLENPTVNEDEIIPEQTSLWNDVLNFCDWLIFEKKFSKLTVKSYSHTLRKFIKELLANFADISSWRQVTDTQVRTVLRQVKNEVNEDEPISERTKAHLVSVLRSFYKYLYMHSLVEKDFMCNIRTPKFTPKLPSYLTYEQFEALVKLPENPTKKDIRDRAIIELTFDSGLRVAELVSLTIDDLDMDEMMLHIVGKGNKERIVPFGSYGKKALEKWFNVRFEYAPQCSNVFVNRFGNPMTTRAVQIILNKIGNENALPIHVSPHKLRHSFATEMLKGGADIKTIQEFLGHSSIATTGVYLHLDIEHVKNVYQKTHPLATKKLSHDDAEK